MKPVRIKEGPTLKNHISFASIAVQGEILARAEANFARLEQEEYQPAHLFQSPGYGWPGDFEGRTMLAWILLSQSTNMESKYLDEVMKLLPCHFNERGYIGHIKPAGCFDEQQLSGHSWLLRALCEYYAWKHDPNIHSIIQNIVFNLLMPAKGYFSEYPIKPEERVKQGEAFGTLTGEKIGSWFVSSDIGCAFIMLDGATHAYTILQEPALQELIEEMIERFISIDFVAVAMQTHATLSALRGMLRYYSCVQKAALLKEAERIYLLYKTFAMTTNYENHNWFGRPDWTEPCAVIDSYMLAVQLWQHTGKEEYLDDAHHIWMNGVGYGQRPSGGFGANVCAGGESRLLHPHPELYEAFWCCSMRGGEGLARAIQYTYFQSGDKIWTLFYHNAIAVFEWEKERLVLSQQTGYPVVGETRLTVKESSLQTMRTIAFYIPGWVDASDVQLLVNDRKKDIQMGGGFATYSSVFQAGDRIMLRFPVELRRCSAVNGDAHLFTYRHGPLLLGADSEHAPVGISQHTMFRYLGDGAYLSASGNIKLVPVNRLFFKSTAEAKKDKKMIIYPVLEGGEGS